MCRGVEAASRPCVEPCVEPDVEPDVEDVEARAQRRTASRLRASWADFAGCSCERGGGGGRGVVIRASGP